MDDPNTRSDLDPAAIRAAANALEIACVNGLQGTDPGCAYTFTRTFEHVNWLDFESLVQAGKTPEESGINDRFHRIEADLDALGDNVRRAFVCLETLRAQLRVCLNEIVTVLNAKEKDSKEKEEAKDTKDNKDSKDSKDTKETKETKDNKDNKEAKEGKDGKDNREAKDEKDATDKDEKERGKDLLGAAEKKDQDGPGGRPSFDRVHVVDHVVGERVAGRNAASLRAARLHCPRRAARARRTGIERAAGGMMFVVLAYRHDVAARALVERWRAAGEQAALLTCADLTRRGWRYVAGNPAASYADVGGQVLATRDIRAVITRMPAVGEVELPHVHEDDRRYAAAEMQAFLLAWLCSLECPVTQSSFSVQPRGPMVDRRPVGTAGTPGRHRGTTGHRARCVPGGGSI